MNVTVAEVLAGAEVRAVPLSAECVGYLVLAAADQISGAPRRVEPNDVLLFEDGGIRVASARVAEGMVAERDLRLVLDALLLRASGPTTGLLRASRRPAGAGVEALVRELETALIPVNRAAAKRALARLERETVRALESGRIKPSSSLAPGPEPSPVAAAVAAPAVAVAREPSAEPLPVAPPIEPSAVPPEVVMLPPPVVASVAVVALPEAPTSSHEPVIAEAAPLAPELAAGESFEPQERTIVIARVAPRPEADAQMVETRPEPVVLRASNRPPPAPPGAALLEPLAAEPVRTEPLPRVTPAVAQEATPASWFALSPAIPPVALPSESPPAVTPLLGTRVVTTKMPTPEPPLANALAAAAVSAADDFVPADDPAPAEEAALADYLAPDDELSPAGDFAAADAVSAAEELSPADAASAADELSPAEELSPADAAPAADDAPQAATVFPDADGQGADEGDVEIIEVLFGQGEMTVIPDDVELIYSQGSDWTEPCPPLAVESMLPPPSAEESEPAQSMLPPPSVEESELPPWVTAPREVIDVTPPPRVALPEARPSDVDDLLLRMGEMPLAVDELRSGLKRLAGMEPTPPPPGIGQSD